jgi:hypothetical protein
VSMAIPSMETSASPLFPAPLLMEITIVSLAPLAIPSGKVSASSSTP